MELDKEDHGETVKKKNPQARKLHRLHWITKEQKETILRMYDFLLEKKPKRRPFKRGTITEVMLEVAKLTGVSKHTVYRVRRERNATDKVSGHKKPGPKKMKLIDKVNPYDREIIRQKIYGFHGSGVLPTVPEILEEVNKDPLLLNYKLMTFHKVINDLYKKTPHTADFLKWRKVYIEAHRKYWEEDKTIYYVGVTTIKINANKVLGEKNSDSNTDFHCDSETDDSDTESSDEDSSDSSDNVKHTKRKIPPRNLKVEKIHLRIGHIGSTNGFVKGAMLRYDPAKYDNNPTLERDRQVRWLESILSRLEPGCVIVMDDKFGKSGKTLVADDENPCCKWEKNKLKKWLKARNVEAKLCFKLKHLRLLAAKYKARHDKYYVEKIVEESGRSVLRIPPHHEYFNPIESAWKLVKSYVGGSTKSSTLGEMKELVTEKVNLVTNIDWDYLISEAIQREDEYWAADHLACEPQLLTNLKRKRGRPKKTEATKARKMDVNKKLVVTLEDQENDPVDEADHLDCELDVPVNLKRKRGRPSKTEATKARKIDINKGVSYNFRRSGERSNK